MRKILFLCACLVGNLLSAQNMTQVIPPSPTAADLGKAGLAVSDMASGELRTNIPLYTLSTRHMNLPIDLSYTARGLKVDAIASRVGLGWLLNAGGMINRTVLGAPDDYSSKLAIPADFPSTIGCTAVDFVNRAISPGWDTQADIFTFSFMGYSGQFFIDNNGQIQKLEQNNLVIENDNFNSFTITTGDGVRYYFKDVESSVSVSSCAGNLYDRNTIRNAWFLSEIDHPDGDIIWFKYDNCQFNYESGINQSFTGVVSAGSLCIGSTPQRFVSCSVTNRSSGVYPIQISSNSGGVIKFWYADRDDLPGDKYLTKLVVIDTTIQKLDILGDLDGLAKTVKSFSFSYEYSNSGNTNALAKRLFLKQVTESPNVLNDEPTKSYKFEYENYSNLPPRLSYSQDYMGFYNGKSNPTMISKPNEQQWIDAFSSYGFGDRNPDWNFSKQGMLNKLIYPTGGYDAIVYEPNNICSNDIPVAPNAYFNYNASGGTFKQLVVTQSPSFSVNANHTASLLAFCNLKSDITPGDTKYYYIVVDLYEDGSDILSKQIMMGQSLLQDVALQAGKTYYFEITHFSDVNSALALNYYNGPVILNKEVPGIRVKQIISVAGTGNGTQKNFFYTTLEDRTRSNAVMYNQNPFNRVYYTNNIQKSCGEGCCYDQCQYIRYTSGTFYDLFSYTGQHIYYPTVLESDNADFSNGFVEHKFLVYMDNVGGLVSGDAVMNSPLSNTSVALNGLEYETNYYKAFNSNQLLLKQVRHSFKDDERLRRFTDFYALIPTGGGASVCKVCGTTIGSLFDFNNVTCMRYQLLSRWVYNDSVITKEFDQDGNASLTTIQLNQYDNALHLLPTKVITFTSQHETLTKITKYPQDVLSEDPAHLNSAGATTDNWQAFNVLAAMNKLDAPVEQLTIRDNKQLEDMVNFYAITPANSAPHLASVNISQLNNPFEKRYEVLKYDAAGNILEQRKTSGKIQSYVWDYNNNYPIAEVLNSSSADLAYSSFESDGSGGWVISGVARSTANSITGKNSYDLSNGNIIKGGLSGSATYIVSYWTTNTNPYTINGTQGTVLRGKSVNGWTYFEHTVSGVAQVEISAVGGLIDELRLYPSGALMTTYTYAPFIGITSQCDARNMLLCYEYDGLNRLLRIRDGDKNIVKQLDYQYQVFPTKVANWQRTGNTRCKPCDANPNYISQFLQAEERDMNLSSPTGGTTRWVNVPGGNCVPMADWQFTSTPIRCKTTNGINSGEQEREQMDMNPCSSSYGIKQWVVVGTNTSVCTICDPATCSTPSTRCVNNHCETGDKVYTSKVKIGVKLWECMFHYEFSDGSWSDNYTETTTSVNGCFF